MGTCVPATNTHSNPLSDPPVASLTSEQLHAVEVVFEHQGTETWKQIAERLGTTSVTLWRWRKLKAFQTEIRRVGRQMLADSLPGTFTALVKKAHSGDLQAIKEHLKLTGEYQEAELREAFGSWLTMLSKAGIPAARQFAMALQTSSRALEMQTGGGNGDGSGVQDAEVIEDGATDDDPLAL